LQHSQVMSERVLYGGKKFYGQGENLLFIPDFKYWKNTSEYCY